MLSGARSSATSARVRRSTSIDARSMVSGFRSKIATGHPADAHSAAQPTPMSPAPITATLWGIVTPSPPRRASQPAARARTAAAAPEAVHLHRDARKGALGIELGPAAALPIVQ